MQLIIDFFLSKEVDAGMVTMLVLGVGVEMSDTKSSKRSRPGVKVLAVPIQGGYEDEDEAVWVIDGAKNLLNVEVSQVRTYPFLCFCICRNAQPTALRRRGPSD